MIIVNKNADYSNVAVSVVDVPVVISKLAQEYLDCYVKQLTTKQIVAFDNFITTLSAGGVLKKIDRIYLPCLAANTREAYFDVKNKVSISDISFTTPTRAYVNQATSSIHSDSDTSLPVEYTMMDIQDASVNLQKFGIYTLFTRRITFNSNNTSYIARVNFPSRPLYIKQELKDTMSFGFTSSGNMYGVKVNHDYNVGDKIFVSFAINGQYLYGSVNGGNYIQATLDSSLFPSGIANETMTGLSPFFGGSINQYFFNESDGVLAQLFGKPLTDEENNTMNKAMTYLKEAF